MGRVVAPRLKKFQGRCRAHQKGRGGGFGSNRKAPDRGVNLRLMPALPLAGKCALVLGPDPPLQAAVADALQAAGAALARGTEAAHYWIGCGACPDDILTTAAACPQLEAVVFTARTTANALAVATLPALAAYWARQLAPRVRVNSLLLHPSAALEAPLIFLLALASFTTGATLTSDGGRSA